MLNLSERGQTLFRWVFYAIVAIAVFMLVVSIVSGFIMDYYWFSSVGYLQVFMVNLEYQLILLFVGWLVTTICLLHTWRGIKKRFDADVPFIGDKVFKVFSVLFGLGIGWWFKGEYMTVLKFLNRASWGVTDPVFGNDISFYIFTLPFIKTALTFVAVVSVVVLFVSVFSYGILRSGLRKEEEEFELEEREPLSDVFDFLRSWPISGSIISLTAVGAISVWLGRYSYLWEFNPGAQVPTGAAYMATHYLIPYAWVKAFGIILLGYIFLYVLRNAEELRYRLDVSGLFSLKKVVSIVLAIIVIFAIVPGAVFGAIDTFNVQPNEPGIERPYLERTIEYTNKAYGLDGIFEIPYTVTSENLGVEEALNSPTVKNARIVDYRPVKVTYEQKQRLRTYYEFPDVDVDRYRTEDGKKLAVISAREMVVRDSSWQNRHLFFTHGFGAVVSPASEKEPDGSPVLTVRDIPPVSDWDVTDIQEPRVYFGERTDDYAIVRAEGLDEFDYPLGENNVQYRYEYDSGIPLDSAWKKLIGWFYTGDFNMIVSDYVGEESKLLLHRNVHDRVKKIAPFLRFDPNAHLFVGADKDLNYLLNGITWAEKYPYSYSDGTAPGYLSDSVKTFVKANTGKVDFYMVDEDDPVAEVYSNIYPDLFHEGEEMSEDFREHLIYPESLFDVQMNIFRRYHMMDYQAFYQKEDMWTSAEERYHGSTKRVEAYNIFLDVNGYSGFERNEEEFTLVQPFTPEGKQNMRAWVGVSQDPTNYGKIMALMFSKGELIRGPMQIESIIDQQEEISQQFSLWDRAGSQVLRGNLLVLPVGGDVLYIEPIYLSAETAPYPQLKRVISVYGDTAAMADNLESAVIASLGEIPLTRPPVGDNIIVGELARVVDDYLDLNSEYRRLIAENRYARAGQIREEMLELERRMAELLRGEDR